MSRNQLRLLVLLLVCMAPLGFAVYFFLMHPALPEPQQAGTIAFKATYEKFGTFDKPAKCQFRISCDGAGHYETTLRNFLGQTPIYQPLVDEKAAQSNAFFDGTETIDGHQCRHYSSIPFRFGPPGCRMEDWYCPDLHCSVKCEIHAERGWTTFRLVKYEAADDLGCF